MTAPVSEERICLLRDQAYNGYVDEWTGDTHDEIAAICTELLAARRGWLPVESAPKTSIQILVWCPDRRNIYGVTWHELSNAWWHFARGGRELMENPTHWRHLPPPPETAEGK